MKTEWPSAEKIEALHKQKLKDIADETAREFRIAVKRELLNSTIWPVIVEKAAYLVLNNPVLKEVEDELRAAGYTTSITQEGALKIERKKS